MSTFTLKAFVAESLRIEGIHREPNQQELDITNDFLRAQIITRSGLEELVSVYQPDAILRNKPGLDVRVGNHIPPRGGMEVEGTLGHIIWRASSDPRTPFLAYKTHQTYETLHPFTDGNGRSGRILWLWQMGGIEKAPLGFLHHWYYQSLAFGAEQ